MKANGLLVSAPKSAKKPAAEKKSEKRKREEEEEEEDDDDDDDEDDDDDDDNSDESTEKEAAPKKAAKAKQSGVSHKRPAKAEGAGGIEAMRAETSRLAKAHRVAVGRGVYPADANTMKFSWSKGEERGSLQAKAQGKDDHKAEAMLHQKIHQLAERWASIA